MKRGSVLERRLVRIAMPLLLTVAVLSYGAELIHLRAGSAEQREGTAFVQALGSAATVRNRATVEHATESLFIKARHGTASATWRLAAGERTVRAGTAIERADVFIAPTDLQFTTPDGFAEIAVDGRPVAHLIGRPLVTADGVRRYVVANADAVPLDTPTGPKRGFRFAIADGDACRSRNCSIGISVRDAKWHVSSVALLFTTAGLAETAMPLRPASSLAIVLAVIAIAALSHLLLSFIRMSFRAGGESAQT